MLFTEPVAQVDHWRQLAEYARYEMAAGGPDVNFKLIGEVSVGLPLSERVWRGGCYMAVYNAPSAESLFQAWPWQRVVAEGKDLSRWVIANFPRLFPHRHRRCVRRAEWMNEYLAGYIRFARDFKALRDELQATKTAEQKFEMAWDAVVSVPRVGRYAGIKLLEYLIHYGGLQTIGVRQTDTRPRGALSNRHTLALLWPDIPALKAEDDEPETLAQVNETTEDTIARLGDEEGVHLTPFELQVFLCEYGQTINGRQYPGKSVDAELGYARKVEKVWDYPSVLWMARKKLCPAECLGELGGWDGPRKRCQEALPKHRYTWSDTLYDYNATMDMARPVRRRGHAGPSTGRRRSGRGAG